MSKNNLNDSFDDFLNGRTKPSVEHGANKPTPVSGDMANHEQDALRIRGKNTTTASATTNENSTFWEHKQRESVVGHTATNAKLVAGRVLEVAKMGLKTAIDEVQANATKLSTAESQKLAAAAHSTGHHHHHSFASDTSSAVNHQPHGEGDSLSSTVASVVINVEASDSDKSNGDECSTSSVESEGGGEGGAVHLRHEHYYIRDQHGRAYRLRKLGPASTKKSKRRSLKASQNQSPADPVANYHSTEDSSPVVRRREGREEEGEGASPPPQDIQPPSSTPSPSATAASTVPSHFFAGSEKDRFTTIRYLSKYPLLDRLPLFAPLARTFGIFVTVALSICYFLTKGVGAHMLTSGALPLYKDVYFVSNARYQAFTTLLDLGWAAKPIVGILTDLVLFRGEHKRGWLVVAVLTSVMFSLVFVVLPVPGSAKEAADRSSYWTSVASFAAVCGFFISFGFATVDLLLEGFYCELMQLAPAVSSMLVSWVWAAIMVGGIVAASLEGPIADNFNPTLCVVIAGGAALLAMYPLYKNWIGEQAYIRWPKLDRGAEHSTGGNGTDVSTGDDVELSSSKPTNNILVEFEDVDAAHRFATMGSSGGKSSKPKYANVPDRQALMAKDSSQRTPKSSPTTTVHECFVPFPAMCVAGQYSYSSISSTSPSRGDGEARSAASLPLTSTFLVLKEKAQQNRPIVLYAALMGLTSISMALSTIHFSSGSAADDDNGSTSSSANTEVNSSGRTASEQAILNGRLQLLMVASTAMVLLSITGFFCLPKTIAAANLFMSLKELLYVRIGGPMDYFYTATPECLANGPHFSYTYYQSFTSIVGYIAGAVGVSIFYKFFSKQSIRKTFFITAVIKILASVIDLIIVNRWNISYLSHLPFPLNYVFSSDKGIYFFGDAIIYQAVQMLDFMPMVLLTSKLCPKGLECTTYAILAGFTNFGAVLSNTAGSLLIAFVFPIRTSKPNDWDESIKQSAGGNGASSPKYDFAAGYCDFNNLPYLLALAHFALPFISLLLIPVMLPNQRMDQSASEAEAEGNAVGEGSATDANTAM